MRQTPRAYDQAHPIPLRPTPHGWRGPSGLIVAPGPRKPRRFSLVIFTAATAAVITGGFLFGDLAYLAGLVWRLMH